MLTQLKSQRTLDNSNTTAPVWHQCIMDVNNRNLEALQVEENADKESNIPNSLLLMGLSLFCMLKMRTQNIPETVLLEG